MTEMQQYLDVLKQLKDFRENLNRGIAAKAYQEQEKIKLEVLIQYCISFQLIVICNKLTALSYVTRFLPMDMLILYKKWKLFVVRDTNWAAKQSECDLK